MLTGFEGENGSGQFGSSGRFVVIGLVRGGTAIRSYCKQGTYDVIISNLRITVAYVYTFLSRFSLCVAVIIEGLV